MEADTAESSHLKEAGYYERLPGDKVRCRLCPHECLIYPGRVGICFIRQNVGGRLFALTYGRISAAHLDPIEKKPLYHFHPGSAIFSISSIGCSLGCPFCQNWELAHPKDQLLKEDPGFVVKRLTEEMSPRKAVESALAYRPQNIGIAYTYNEPLIWFEYLLDTAKAARLAGLKNVVITNGYLHLEPLAELLPYIDAMNIDVKGFSDEFYLRLGGRLEPVLRLAEEANKVCHVEITNLLIPGWNSNERQVRELTNWVADRLGPDTPLHFSRYFPARKLKEPPTSLEELKRAGQIGEERLAHVYLGNV